MVSAIKPGLSAYKALLKTPLSTVPWPLLAFLNKCVKNLELRSTFYVIGKLIFFSVIESCILLPLLVNVS